MKYDTKTVSYVISFIIIIFGVYGFLIAISDLILIIKRLVS